MSRQSQTQVAVGMGDGGERGDANLFPIIVHCIKTAG